MLTSLIIAYFVLHGGTSALVQQHIETASKLVDKNITVEATKKQAIAILDSAKKENEAYLDSRKKTISALKPILANRATTDAELAAAMKPFLAEESVNANQMTDRLFELRKVLSASDWAKVFPAPEPAKK
jgi:hypothetical protein